MYSKLELSTSKMIESDIAKNKIYGAAVRIGERDKVLVDVDIGVKNDDLFRLASMTKPITAVAVLLEAERNHLQLDEPIKKYLPDFADMLVGKLENGRAVPSHKAESDIKIFHLLSHTSGVLSGDLGEQLYPDINLHRQTLADAVEYYPKTLLAFDPFTKESYSPLAAFDIAARIVELVSGLKYDEYLNTNIFRPLEIKDTAFSLPPERRARLAPMHSLDENAHSTTIQLKGTMGNLPDTYFFAGGGLAGSSDDYAKFARMLSFDGKGLLKSESLAKMRTEVWPGWGLGVRIIKKDRYLPEGSFGWSGAYGTHFWVDPSQGLYAIYMKNSLYDGGSGAHTAREFEKVVMENIN